MAIIQRFGGALNLNLHIHALVLDGVFARDGAGEIAFDPARYHNQSVPTTTRPPDPELRIVSQALRTERLRENRELRAHRERRETDKIEQTCRDAGYEPPVICTPEESRFGRVHGYDLQRIARALQDEESKGGRKLVALNSMTVRPQKLFPDGVSS